MIVVIVALVGGGAYLATRGKNDKTNSTPTTVDHMPTKAPSATNPSANANSVTIENFAFSPASITVKKGTAVTWANKDNTSHTVTETDGQKGPDSGNMANGKNYSFTYDSVGTFKYHCSIHPSMTGTVTVTE